MLLVSNFQGLTKVTISKEAHSPSSNIYRASAREFTGNFTKIREKMMPHKMLYILLHMLSIVLWRRLGKLNHNRIVMLELLRF